uniref:histidine kinase n=1 Tax=Mycena chlorophos TaxID=658473 RepID=A0ABQ0M731_MYCCL|nr:histidine kinase [Mycena chlorophos]
MSSFRSVDKPGLVELVSMSLPPPALQKTTNASKDRRRIEKKARFGVISGVLSTLATRFGSVSSPSLSSDLRRASVPSTTGAIVADAENQDSDAVDRIVVDRTWTTSESRRSQHDDDNSREKSSHGATALTPQDGWQPLANNLQKHSWLATIGERSPMLMSLCAAFVHFFRPTFPDKDAERHYRREDWSMTKPLAIWAAFWLIVNWALGAGFSVRPRTLLDDVFLYAVAPAFSVPVIVLVAFNWPRRHSIAYQCFVGFSLHMWAVYYVLTMYLCGFYPGMPHRVFSCPNKDFIGLLFYFTALPVIGLFGLKMQRITAVIGGLSIFIVIFVLVIPYHPVLARTMVNYFIFMAFIIYAHYIKERAERRLHTLRNQLKTQFKATQRAQINERNASESKTRLTSYVRVPLNSALLALQNINSSGIITKDHEIEFGALNYSLSMMRNVLNDILDFNRMDSGNFEVSSRPFAFHTAMQSLFVPLRLSAESRGQEFVAKLDPDIDKVARWATYQAMGETASVIKQHMKEHPEVAGVVTGDQVRLQQIVNNLASNATKFTPAGGSITITTKLLYPTPDEVSAIEDFEHLAPPPPLSVPSTPAREIGNSTENGSANGHPLSRTHLSQHNIANGIMPAAELKKIVVRIEVTDTGYGITRKDMDECNLFAAFNQTPQGRQQGGKGTGLGLALVRQIVKHSGGRLGVRSKAGVGSCFWIELPLGIGRDALVAPDMESEHSSTDPDITKVRTAARTSADIPVSKHSLTMAVDSVAMKNSAVKPPVDRSASAIHNIMEQDGRVELGLLKSAENLSHAVNAVAVAAAGSSPTRPLVIGGSITSSSAASTANVDSDVTPQAGSGSTTTPTGRPTYLPMPSPKRFMKDAHPTSSTNTSGISSNSNASSPLIAFDTAFQGIPASSSSLSLPFDPGLSVLIVDDDLVTRKVMQRMLTRLGCVVQTAENGQSALVALGAIETPASETSNQSRGPILERAVIDGEEERFDVIFLDNQMPILSGLNAVAKLREWGRTDFVVGVTGNALLQDQEDYIAAGADHVLTKPINEQALKRMLSLADSRRKNRLARSEPP